MQVFIDCLEINQAIDKIKTYAMNNILDFTNGIPDDYVACIQNPNHVFVSGTFMIVYSVERQKISGQNKLLHHVIEKQSHSNV